MSRKTSLPVSDQECAASATIEAEPVSSAATDLATASSAVGHQRHDDREHASRRSAARGLDGRRRRGRGRRAHLPCYTLAGRRVRSPRGAALRSPYRCRMSDRLVAARSPPPCWSSPGCGDDERQPTGAAPASPSAPSAVVEQPRPRRDRPPPARGRAAYVALGDSYTSAPLVPETDTNDACLRSTQQLPRPGREAGALT